MQKYGPKEALSPSLGELCPLCNKPFVIGDYTAQVSVTRQADKKSAYSNKSIEVHWTCAQYDPDR